MTAQRAEADWERLSQRFAALPADKRAAFIAALDARGLDFERLPIVPLSGDGPDRLALAQRRMWFLWRLDPQSPAYNLGGALELDGELDEAALERSILWLTARHEMLRTRFEPLDDGDARPVTLPAPPLSLAVQGRAIAYGRIGRLKCIPTSSKPGAIPPLAKGRAGWGSVGVELHPEGSPPDLGSAEATLPFARGGIGAASSICDRPGFQGEGSGARSDWTPTLILDDVGHLSEAERAAAARAVAERALKTPFDLVAAPPVRFGLVRIAPDRALFWIALHHIVTDGWSIEVMVDELFCAYAAFRSGAAPAPPAPPIRHADHAEWRRARLEAGELDRQRDWWTKELGADHRPVTLPTDRPRPAAQSFRGARARFAFDAELSGRLRSLAKAEGASVFMALLACLHALLARLGGDEEIRVGVSSANRDRPETEKLLGFFVTTQVISARPTAATRFRDLLASVRAKTLAAQSRQDLPFETLVEALQPERSLGHNPLFQVKFTQQLETPREFRAGGLVARPVELAETATRFDLNLDVTDREEGLEATLTYATDLFDEGFAARFADQLCDLASHVCDAPEAPLGEWTPKTVSALAGEAAGIEHATVLSAFAANVRARPDAEAARSGEAGLSFRALDEASTRLAYALSREGVGPETVVAVAAGRSVALVVALIGVMKAGGVYAPLDLKQPAERLKKLVSDSGAALVLADAEGAPVAQAAGLSPRSIAEFSARTAPDDAPALREPSPLQAAYLIYTSGSTGEPKGVVVPHGAIAAYAQAMLARFDLSDGASFGMVSTPAADLGHTVLFGALVSGRTLHLIETDAAFDADRLADIVRANRIGVLKLVPSHLEGLLATPRGAEILPEAGLILGGEALPWRLVEAIRRMKPGLRVLNHYGPTETTVGVLSHEPGEGEEGGVPVGAPFANVSAVVLDQNLDPTPPGAVGELFIGGAQVARGYLGRPGATAERFVPDPARPGGRLYRTGDFVRLDYHGALVFVGRRDDQVKIRGHRVELREVASVARRLDGVEAAEVALRRGEAGRDQLVAYLVAPADVAAGAREKLARVLPDHMVPAHVVRLERMPLTPNGKLDRAALPAPQTSPVKPAEAAQDSDAEGALRAIWTEVLRRGDFGLDDNFFALGGDSILSLQVIARMKRRGFRLTPKQVFERQTIRALAQAATPLAPKAPENLAEAALREIWAEVLRRQDVGLDDNFFALGGDSILSLQVIARMKRRGFRLTPKQVFERQTIRALAEAATPLDGAAPKPSPVSAPAAEAPLTPIQRAFFAQEIPNRAHWNQSVLLTPRAPLDPAALERALAALVARHDALRLRFTEKNGRVVQTCRPTAETEGLLRRLDAPDAASLTAACEDAQRSLDIAQGPLVRALLATLPGGAQRLMIAIHHLAVDGVSWRVLLEDLALALEQQAQGEAIALPAVETSFSAYAQRMLVHAHSESLRDELDHWRALAGPDAPATGTTLAEARRVRRRIDGALAKNLLGEPNGARPHELMAAALARAVAPEGAADVRLWLESHGRETPFEELDLTRTVGWLTAIHPLGVRLGADAGQTLAAVREAVRKTPFGGLGYGLLRHLSEFRSEVAAPRGPVLNYLGRFDGSLSADQPFSLAQEPYGAERDPSAPLADPLRLDARSLDGALVLDWTFDPAVHDEAASDGVVATFEAELRKLLGDAAEPEDRSYPLSPMQQGLFFQHLLAPRETAYVNLLAVTFEGLDFERFKDAWRSAFARHDILRTTFEARDGAEPRQTVRAQAEPRFEEHDFRGAADLDTRLDQLCEDERARGFDLSAEPPTRLTLVRIADDRWRFLWVRHHILLDGWSSARLLAEIAETYRGAAPRSPAPRFEAFVEWLAARDAKADEAFWRAALAGLDEPFRLAGGAPRGEQGRGRHLVRLDASATDALRAAARENRVTLNTLVQGAWALVLSRRARRPAVFGVTVAGRPDDLEGAEETLGLFINTLPLVADPRPEIAVADFLADLQSRNVAMRERQHLPLFEIQRLAPLGGEALFDTLVVFENYPVDPGLKEARPGALVFRDPEVREDTHYALTLTVEAGEEIALGLGYARDAVSDGDVEAIGRELAAALNGLAADGGRPLGAIGLGDSSPAVDRAPAKPFVATHDAVRRRAAETPGAPAVRGADGAMTYAELDRRSDAVAARLRAMGVTRGDRVGVFVERGAQMLAALVGVMKAGAAYTPLDPAYPEARLAYMAADAGLKALVSQGPLLARAPAGDWATLDLDAVREEGPAPRFEARPDDLAYVIYTSGSTGRPKGVMVGHGALANLLSSMASTLCVSPRDRLVAVTSLSFDIAALELFLPLLAGASVTVATREQAGAPRELAALLDADGASLMQAASTLADDATPSFTSPRWGEVARRSRAGEGDQGFPDSEAPPHPGLRPDPGSSPGQALSPPGRGEDLRLASGPGALFLQATPATWRQLMESGWRGRADLTALCGGEALPPDLAAWLSPRVGALWNVYGPTETTIWSSARSVRAEDAVAIGGSLAATGLYALDEALQPVPPGSVGELWISGDGLARGYHGRPGLTAERFAPDPFSGEGARMYRTGDLVRLRADGAFDVLGRLDHQVKLRGFRIELGEIEAALRAHPAVRDAAVATLDETLAAYVVAASWTTDETLLAHLGDRLPAHMLPSVIVRLDRLPATPNGKLDRGALPRPERASRGFEAPDGETEAALAGIWSRLLRVDRVGREDHFFRLGGHSLTATRMVAQAEAELGAPIPLRTIFDAPTLKGFAATIEATRPSGDRLARVDALLAELDAI